MARLAAIILLVLLAPVLCLIWIMLLPAIGRPVLFRQYRSGLGGQPFELVKFRSMTDERDEAGRLLPDDQRVTPTGKFLRRTRLDELPGLWNVAKGDMAFVGPRPLLPETIADLGAKGIARGRVRPGMTGWAQVNGNTLLSLQEKIDLDLWYVEHANWRLDLMILIRTVLVMFAGERLNGRVAETRRP